LSPVWAQYQIEFGPVRTATLANTSSNVCYITGEVVAIYQTALDPCGGFLEATHHYGLVLNNGEPTSTVASEWSGQEIITFLDYTTYYEPYPLQPGQSITLSYWEWYTYLDLPAGYTFSFVQFNIDSNCTLLSCTNSTTTNVICGAILNPGTLTPASVQVCVGGSISTPTVSGAMFADGQVQTVVSNCANGTLTTNTTPVTYSPTIEFTPQLQTTFTNLGTHTFSVQLIGVSSDARCLNLTESLGTFTVEVVDTAATNVFVECGGLFLPGRLLSTNVQVCINSPVPTPGFILPVFTNGSVITEIVTCSTGVTNRTTNEITYTVGSLEFDPPIPGSFPDPTNFTTTAYVAAIPSDTNCPPITNILGSLTISAVTNITTNVVCAVNGALTNTATLSWTSQHICVGDSLSPPTLSGAAFTDGEYHVIIVDCMAGTTNITTNVVTYTAGSVEFYPAFPGHFPTPGSFAYVAVVRGQPSTNICPEVIGVLGTVTVTVGSTTTNEVVQCGSILSSGGLYPASVQICTNTSVAGPNLIPPVFGSGLVTRTVRDCNTGNTTITTTPITYSPGGVEWDPPWQGTFTNAGTYSFTAKVTAQPSDSRCAPLTAVLGTFTVQVTDTSFTNVVCAVAGSVLNAGTLSFTNVQICVYGSISAPGAIGTVFKNGELHTTVVNCAAGTTNITTNVVTYTSEPLEFDPPIPLDFPETGQFSFTAKIKGIPSDNRCPEITATVGTLNVTVSESLTNVVVICGSVASSGALTPSSVQVCVNGSVGSPAIIFPVFAPGAVFTVVTDCYTGDTNITSVPITYTPGSLYFDPQLPASFTTPGNYSFTAKMDAAPSDSRCGPLTATLCTLSVTVVTNASTNVVFQCGGLLTPGSLTATNQTICIGNAASAPGVVAPVFTNGVIFTNVVNCATGTTNTSTGTITYSAGPLYFDPPIPPSFPDVGSYSYTAMMDGLPADTNCPPITTSLGTFTVEVVDTSFTNVTVQCGTVTNENTLMVTNVICVGDSISAPAVTNTFFVPGQIVRSEFDCYYGTTNHFTNAVTYTPQVRFDPPLPAGPMTTPGVYQFEVYVDGLSSTNACPNLTAHAGSLTVIVSSLTLSASSTNACKGSAVTFTAQGQPPGLSYNWTVTGGQSTLSNGDSMNTVVFTNTGLALPVTVSYGGCTQTVTVAVYSLTLTPTNFVTAAGVTNVFVASGEPPGLPYSWSEGGSTGPTNLVVFSSPTTNQQLTVTYGPCSQTTTGSVISLSVRAVTFGGSTRHGVLKDDGTGEYPSTGTNYHWTPTNSYPVCYTRNTTPTVWDAFTVLPTNFTGSVKIRAKGPDALDVPETTAQLTFTSTLFAVFPSFVNFSASFTNTVHFYDQMGLQWEYAAGAGTDFAPAGSSSNQVYVTLRAPTNGVPVYHTVVHLSCKNATGQSTDGGTADAVFVEFTDRIVRRLSDNKQMTYWLNNTSDGTETETLLREPSANGNCQAWSALLRDCFRVQGLQADRIRALPVSPADGGICVKNWQFVDPPSGSGQHPYIVGTDAFDLIGVEAQGNTNPPGWFNGHWITLCNDAYYDPSYGTPKVSGSDKNKTYEDGSLAGYVDSNGTRVRKNNVAIGSPSELEYTVDN
jgi:hypothetical protein